MDDSKIVEENLEDVSSEVTIVEGEFEDEVIKEQEETFKQMSPIRLIFRRFFRSKLSIVGLVLIVVLFLFSFVGPLFSSYGQAEQDLSTVYIETTQAIDVTDSNGNVLYTIYETVTTKRDMNILADPSSKHWLGTDAQSYDVLTRLMYGGRIMRIVDIFNCIPTLPILLIASMVIDAWKLTDSVKIYFIMIIITIFSWSGTARLVRGQILYLREQEYITATEVMGLPTWRRIFKHLIPNVMPQLIVSMTLGLGSVILYESTLSYLGLGVSGDTASWGTMISTCKERLMLMYHVNVWLPAGLMIVLAVLGFNFIGDGLRDAMDPKSKK